MQFSVNGFSCQVYMTEDNSRFKGVGLVDPNVIQIESFSLEDLKIQFAEAISEMVRFSSGNVTYFRIKRYSALVLSEDGTNITGSIIKQNSSLLFSADNFQNAAIAINTLINKYETLSNEGENITRLSVSVREEDESETTTEQFLVEG